MSGFHGAFATGVASQQGTLTLPDTWFRPPFWDLLMLQLLRPNSSNLPCLYSTFHLEYPLVLSRFCFQTIHIVIISSKIKIPNKGCKWINYILLIAIQKLLLEFFRFWSCLVVTCLSTPLPLLVILYVTLFSLQLESIFRYISYHFNSFYIVPAVKHWFRDIFFNLLAFHKARSTTKFKAK